MFLRIHSYGGSVALTLYDDGDVALRDVHLLDAELLPDEEERFECTDQCVLGLDRYYGELNSALEFTCVRRLFLGDTTHVNLILRAPAARELFVVDVIEPDNYLVGGKDHFVAGLFTIRWTTKTFAAVALAPIYIAWKLVISIKALFAGPKHWQRAQREKK